MYDPFAQPAGPIATTALAPNNALAPVAQPVAVPVQQAPGMRRPMFGMRPFDRQGFQQAMLDWRGQRPQFAYDPTLDANKRAQHQDFRSQLVDWRGLRPDRMGYYGATPPVPTAGA